MAEVSVVAAPDDRLGERAAAVAADARRAAGPDARRGARPPRRGRPGAPEVAGVAPSRRRAPPNSVGEGAEVPPPRSSCAEWRADGNAVLRLQMRIPTVRARGADPMTTITTEKLTPTVGAVVEGVDREHLLDDDAFPGWCLEALERNGVLVFPDLHLDDATQVAWSTRLGRVEKLGRGEHPEIFRVNLDPATNPSAAYLRGAFVWHIDGCTEDIPIMATMLSAHVVAETGGETEFASSYAAYDALDDEEKATRGVVASGAHHRSLPAAVQPRPIRRRRWRCGAGGPPRSTRWCGPTAPVASRSCSGATADHVVGMESEESRALLDDLLARATAPERVYRHHWSVGRHGHLGQPGRAAPCLPLRRGLGPRHAPHHLHRRRSDPVSARTAIVTGGGSGIGLAIARRLAADRAAVAVLDRDGDSAAGRGRGDRGLGRVCRGPRGRRHRSPWHRGGRGRGRGALGAADDPGEQRRPPGVRAVPAHHAAAMAGRILEVNLTGTFHCCQVVLPHMISAGWGRIVNISSSSAQSGQPLMAHYVSSKAGVIGLTKALALEFGPKGITVNTIPPGFVDTPMLRASEEQGFLGEGVEHHEARTPVRRIGRPEDIAAACAFLVSDEASYVTGQVIGVNGGRNT